MGTIDRINQGLFIVNKKRYLMSGVKVFLTLFLVVVSNSAAMLFDQNVRKFTITCHGQ